MGQIKVEKNVGGIEGLCVIEPAVHGDIQDRSLTLNVIVAVLTIVAMLFGPELIKIFATEEYYQAIWIIPPVAMSVFFNSIYSVFVNIEFYYEKTKYVMYVTVVLAGLNIVLNYIGIKICGFSST